MQGDILAMPAPGGGVPAAGAPSYSRPLSRNHRHSRSSISLSSLGSLGSSLLDSALDMLNPQSRATPPPPAARESPRPGSPASLAPSLAASSLAPDADADGDFFVSSAFRRGSFGTMRHAVFRPTGEKLVCKCISDGRKASPAPSLPDVMSSSCESETIVADDDAPRLSGEQGTEDPGGQLAVVQEALLCSILEGMDNIVRLRGFQELPSERQYRLFFDFVDGCDLSALAGSGRRLNESDMRPLAFGVFRAVQTCHRLGISHRDLKLENIMLRRDAHPPLDWSVGADRQNQRRRSDNCGIPLHRGGASGNSAGRVVLVDFGSATTCPVDTRECGTYAYLGPEILDSSGPYDPQRADVFALGTILHLMAFGTHPFPNDPSCTTAQRVQQMRAGPEFPASIYVSAELKDLICQCLRPDPAARPTVAQALEHPWIRNDKFHVAGLSWRRLSGSFKLGSFAELPQPPAFSAAGQGMTPLSGAPQGGVPGLRRFSGSRGTDKAAVALAEARRWTEAVRRVECDRGMDPAGKAAALRRLLAERLDRPRH